MIREQSERIFYPYYNYGNNTDKFSKSTDDVGNTTTLTKDTPFIKYLIDKRIYFCQLGSSSHIAAFLSSSLDSGCFIQYGKWNCYYRRKFRKTIIF